MNLDRVAPGETAPDVINVIIEITACKEPVKYEVDKSTGAMFVDRFLATPMFYPCLLYTSPSPRDQRGSRMPSSA